MQRPDNDTDPITAHRAYHGHDRPDIEVLVDDAWRPGELRAWTQRRDTGWWGHVQYSLGAAQNYLDVFPADRIREPELSAELLGVRALSQRNFPDDQARDAAIHAELQIDPLRYQMQLEWLRHHGHLDDGSAEDRADHDVQQHEHDREH